jgi:uncharacterized coiled-coil protein SlyX
LSEDPILAALARVEATVVRLEGTVVRLEGTVVRLEGSVVRLETDLMTRVNTKLDDILDKLRAVREDTDNTQAHVLYGLQQNLTLGQRITKLEDQMRRAGH